MNKDDKVLESIKEDIDIILGTFNGDKQKTFDFWMDVYPNNNPEEKVEFERILKEYLELE